MSRGCAIAVWLQCLLACSPAEREADTLRLAVAEPIIAIDPFILNRPDWTIYAVYDSLIGYDISKGEAYPLLAKSWRRVGETTLEFELRDDVSFHDGSHFDADDVIATIAWLIDPESVYPSKSLYSWIASVEKLGPYRVRLTATEPRAGDLQNLGYSLRILSAELFEPLEDKSEYGRLTPVGTGPYRVVQLDRNRGIVLERMRNYAHGGTYRDPEIDRVRLSYVPDRFAQIAMLLTGELDLVKDLAPDQVELLLERAPELTSTVSPGMIFAHIRFDSINRAGNPALMDARVRRALIMAIDRRSLAEHIVPGGQVLDAMCLRLQPDCDYSTATPAYDLVAARELLRQAGYPQGFELEISSTIDTESITTAVAGNLAALGVRAAVRVLPDVTFLDKLRLGEVQASVTTLGMGNGNGSYIFWRGHFSSTGNDYWDDALLDDVYVRGNATLDDHARAAIYKQGFDHINASYYMAPLVGIPTVYVHSDRLHVQGDPVATEGSHVYDMRWVE